MALEITGNGITPTRPSPLPACPGLLTNRILEAATVSGGSRGPEAL